MNRLVFFLMSLMVFSMLSGCLGSQPPAPVTRYGEDAGAGSVGVHAVIDGDTLWSVSKRYNISMRDIAVVNHIHAPFVLYSGQRLNLPPPREYQVQDGDTLYSVSRLFGVNQFDIARQNNLRAPYVLRRAQILRLPSEMLRDDPITQDKKQHVRVARRVDQESVSRNDPGPNPGKKPVMEKSGKVKVSAPRQTKITARTPKRSSSKFASPVQGKVISRYGPKEGGLHNDGINIAAPRGTAVKAAENGVVVYAGNEIKGSGNLVLIRHSDRWMSAYAHMDGVNVKRGQVLQRGTKIGTVGSTGSVSTPQLHFELRRGTEAINPKLYM